VLVAFESKMIFKTRKSHLIGSRLKPGAFKLWLDWIQLALPHRGAFKLWVNWIQLALPQPRCSTVTSVHVAAMARAMSSRV
jgi:hypothetical protein